MTQVDASLDLNEPLTWPIGAAPAPKYCGEDERLMVLASFDLDALHGDGELARIARFAAHLCGTPNALVSLVEAERQRFLVAEGMDVSETPRSTSFCAHTMTQGDLIEVLDATKDDRFKDFSLVTGDAHLRYYAGAPLISSEGAPLGALCVLDSKARTEPLSNLQREGLMVLAEAVKRRLQAHRYANSADFALKASAARVQFVLDSVPDVAWSAGPGGTFDFFNARWTSTTGLPKPADVDDWRAAIHPDDYEESLKEFSACVQNAEPFEGQWRLRQSDGSYRWVLSRAVPSTNDPQTARWFGTLTDIDDSRKVLEQRELLAGELAHRIKNIFSVIIGLIAMHARGDETVKVFSDVLSDHIRALSRAQEFALKLDRQVEDDLHSLISLLMQPYGVPGSNPVSVSGEKIVVGARAATPLALVFHELATNSAKYGALSSAAGTIKIEIARENGDVSICWEETGGPPAKAPESNGFGSRLMMLSVQGQLGGKLEQEWRDEGLRAVLTIPADRLAE